jgi:hypothetical protein
MRQGAKGEAVGPAVAVELPCPSQVRSSHLAKQSREIWQWKERSVEKGEWAVLRVSLRNSVVLQPG